MYHSKNYRIKEVIKYGKNYFAPQKKVLWWWDDITEIIDADLSGWVDERVFKFKTYDDCRNFLDSKIHTEDIIYHYI